MRSRIVDQRTSLFGRSLISLPLKERENDHEATGKDQSFLGALCADWQLSYVIQKLLRINYEPYECAKEHLACGWHKRVYSLYILFLVHWDTTNKWNICHLWFRYLSFRARNAKRWKQGRQMKCCQIYALKIFVTMIFILNPSERTFYGNKHFNHDGNSTPTHAHQRQPSCGSARLLTQASLLLGDWGPELYIFSLNLIRYFFRHPAFLKNISY